MIFMYVMPSSGLEISLIMAGTITLTVSGTLIFLGIYEIIGLFIKQSIQSFFDAAADKIADKTYAIWLT